METNWLFSFSVCDSSLAKFPLVKICFAIAIQSLVKSHAPKMKLLHNGATKDNADGGEEKWRDFECVGLRVIWWCCMVLNAAV